MIFLADNPQFAVAAAGRARPEDHRRRADHPGGDAGPARAHQRGPLVAPCTAPTCENCSRICPSSPATTSGCAGSARSAGGRGLGPRRPPVDRRRVGGRLDPGRVRPFPRDGQAFGPGRVGRVRLLRQPLPVLLGAAAAPAVHPARSPGRVRPGRGEGRRAPDPAGDLRSRPRTCPPGGPGRS